MISTDFSGEGPITWRLEAQGDRGSKVTALTKLKFLGKDSIMASDDIVAIHIRLFLTAFDSSILPPSIVPQTVLLLFLFHLSTTSLLMVVAPACGPRSKQS